MFHAVARIEDSSPHPNPKPEPCSPTLNPKPNLKSTSSVCVKVSPTFGRRNLHTNTNCVFWLRRLPGSPPKPGGRTPTPVLDIREVNCHHGPGLVGEQKDHQNRLRLCSRLLACHGGATLNKLVKHRGCPSHGWAGTEHEHRPKLHTIGLRVPMQNNALFCSLMSHVNANKNPTHQCLSADLAFTRQPPTQRIGNRGAPTSTDGVSPGQVCRLHDGPRR